MRNFEKNAATNAFFKKVWDSQKAWADLAIPFWSRAPEIKRRDERRLRRRVEETKE